MTKGKFVAKVVVLGDTTTQVIYQKVKAGEDFALDAPGTVDPDEDHLSYTWWVYREAGTYRGELQIKDPMAITTTFDLDRDAVDSEVHVVLTVMTRKGGSF